LNGLLQLPDCRLLTVVGPGGIGKTRLVLAAAQTILDFGFRISDWNDHANPKSKIQNLKFADGVYFVPLAPLAAAEFIIPAIANALGFIFSGSTEPTTQLLNYLRRKGLLLVLDNFEPLLDGVSLITVILEQTTATKLLVTSRERLNLLGEWVFELQGLPTPPAQSSPAWEASQHYSSVGIVCGACTAAAHRFCPDGADLRVYRADLPAGGRDALAIDWIGRWQPASVKLACNWRQRSCGFGHNVIISVKDMCNCGSSLPNQQPHPLWRVYVRSAQRAIWLLKKMILWRRRPC
jgi:hypothetical protein